ncbi:MAG: TetR/AcrR family transcriptional regulator [Thermoleophilia bacterium]
MLDAAIRVLSETPEASMETIADAAGLARATLYRRFAGRGDLLRAVCDRVSAERERVFRESVAEETDPVRCIGLMARRQVLLGHRFRFMSAPDGDRRTAAEPDLGFTRWVESAQHAGGLRGDVSVAWLVAMIEATTRASLDAIAREELTTSQAAEIAADALMAVAGPR